MLEMKPPNGGATRAGSVVGFDFGTKNIGVAVGQTATGSSAPLCTIRLGRHGEPWKTISELVVTWRPLLFVVGLAYRSDGSQNPITEETYRFCRHLEKRYRLAVHSVDETLSTAESRRWYFAERGGTVAQYREVKDQLAAQVILQSWLDQYAA